MPSARLRRTNFKNQDTEVIGGGAVLVDLNQPIPRPDPKWLVLKLIAEDVKCEYPACDSGAFTFLQLGKHAPFVCIHHGEMLLSPNRTIRTAAVDEIIHAMLHEITLVAFGKTVNPVARMRRQVREPLVARGVALPVLSVTFNRPKLGQKPP